MMKDQIYRRDKMSDENDTERAVEELTGGIIKKGGVNTAPSTPRPDPPEPQTPKEQDE